MTGFSALESLARAGFLVKGVLYMVMGGLALQVALMAGGRITGAGGALTTVLRQPFGRTAMIVAAIGLLGYAAWRILQAIFDPDRHGRDAKGIATRAGYALRGIIYAGLGVQAFRLFRGLGAPSGATERKVAAEAFQWPFGEWLVVLAGLALIAFAVHQAMAAIRCRLERNLDVARMRREVGEWMVGVCRFGVGARAVVLALLGWTFVVAGWSEDVSEVATTASTMGTLAGQPGALGKWLLGATAAGFIAYGFYEMLHSRYLHIRRLG